MTVHIICRHDFHPVRWWYMIFYLRSASMRLVYQTRMNSSSNCFKSIHIAATISQHNSCGNNICLWGLQWLKPRGVGCISDAIPHITCAVEKEKSRQPKSGFTKHQWKGSRGKVWSSHEGGSRLWDMALEWFSAVGADGGGKKEPTEKHGNRVVHSKRGVWWGGSTDCEEHD